MPAKRKDIDAKVIQMLAQRGCTIEEMAAHYRCSRDTIERNFAAIIDKGRADLRMSLREWQIQSAKRGNVAMMIWLGKQYLNQSDKIEEKVETKNEEVHTLNVTIGWADEPALIDAAPDASASSDPPKH
jgi:hypothetical protein